MLSNATGTSCRPVPEGAYCGRAGRRCSQGFCGGRPADWNVSSSEQQDGASGSSSSSSDSVTSHGERQPPAPVGDAAEELSQPADGEAAAEAEAAGGAVVGGADAPVPRVLAARAMRSSKSAKSAKSSKASRASVAPGDMRLDVKRLAALQTRLQSPQANWPTARAVVNPGKKWTRLQDTFLATSHAYTRIQDYGDERMAHAWGEIFGMLSPSPVLRIGGANQDKLVTVPGEDVFKALAVFREHTNARFVFGLPLWPKDAIGMSKLLMSRAQKYLGSSIIAYELGNEPEYWPTGLGGWASGKWQPGFDAYLAWFDKVAREINPCGSKKMLSGPGWGNLNTQPTDWWGKVMYKGARCYLQEMNVHYYPYIDNATATAQQLLSQPLQDFGLGKFREYQRISSKTNMGIRISETNSLYGGGRADLCDTMVGTLWVVDALFAYANAGAKAFHLHWGSGGDPINGDEVQPNVGVMTNYYYDVKPGRRVPPVPWPSVHAPWYGYLFWMLASAGGYGRHVDTNFVDAYMEAANSCDANMKVWSLRADSGELRTALINKSVNKGCNVCFTITDTSYCKKQAVISRLLPGSDGIFSKGGITIQGQTYERWNINWDGKILGDVRTQQTSARWFKDKCGFCAAMPAASAALVVARK